MTLGLWPSFPLESYMQQQYSAHYGVQRFFEIEIELPNKPIIKNTPARTLSISRLKSRVLKLSFVILKMMVKSGLEFILKLTEPLQRYLLSCQANSAILGRYFCTGQQQLWRGSVNLKINSRPLFTVIFKLKNDNFKTRDFSPLIKRVITGVTVSYTHLTLPTKA